MSDGGALAAVVARLAPLGRADAPLGARTTYRVGGSAAVLVDAEGVDALRAVAAAVAGTDVPVLVVGKGSNLLVADAGFAGVVVALGEAFADVEVLAPPDGGDGSAGAAPPTAGGGPPTVAVRAGGAAALPVVARRTAAAGLTGFEWAVGVPGSVGGAVRMNAGGHGSDMAASLRRVRLFDLRSGEDREVAADRLDLGYRRSSVRADEVVVWAELALAPGQPGRPEAEIAEVVRWRRANQPGGANAGSVFTNPPGDSAGRLIDRAGAKGLRVGTAAVSTKHANFIQADEGGRADDVLALMVAVRRRVLADAGVALHAETRLVGFPGTPGGPPGPPPEVVS